MQTPTELEQSFYDNRYKKEEEDSIDYCEICKKDTIHNNIVGHNGLEKYFYGICSECGNKC